MGKLLTLELRLTPTLPMEVTQSSIERITMLAFIAPLGPHRHADQRAQYLTIDDNPYIGRYRLFRQCQKTISCVVVCDARLWLVIPLHAFVP